MRSEKPCRSTHTPHRTGVHAQQPLGARGRAQRPLRASAGASLRAGACAGRSGRVSHPGTTRRPHGCQPSPAPRRGASERTACVALSMGPARCELLPHDARAAHTRVSSEGRRARGQCGAGATARGDGAGGRLWRRHLPAIAAQHTIPAARECAARPTPDRMGGEGERAGRSRAPSGALQVGAQASAPGARAGGGGGWGGRWGSGGGDGAESVTAGGIGGARALAMAPGARAPARGLGGASAAPTTRIPQKVSDNPSPHTDSSVVGHRA